MLRLRIELQAGQAERGEPLGNQLDPGTLRPLTRGQLVQAFQAVAARQKQLARYVPLGL